jgi:hypothetical protein
VWLRHYAASRKFAGSIPDDVNYFNSPNPSGRTRSGGFTQRLTEMSTRSRRMFLGSRARPVRRADDLSVICEPIA